MSNIFVDVENVETEATPAESNIYSAYGAIAIGNGTNVFRADQSGIWLGAKEFSTAPFKVDMQGNVTMTTATITGYVATGGAAADVNAGVTTIVGSKINITGDTTFASGYNPADKVDEVGGNYVSTSTAAAAKVKIFPDADTGIVAYASNGTSVVFKVEVGGTNVGDVTIGNYAGGYGALWDQSAGVLYIKGNVVAGNIDADRISSGTLSTSRIPNLSADKITSGTIDADVITVENISATNITTGTLTVNGTGVSKIVASSSGYDDTGFYTWSSGSKIWNDSSGYVGMKATGERFYFYTGSVLYALFQRGASAGFYSGIYSYGSFNVGESDEKYNSRFWGSVWINTSSSPSERLWVEGSAKVTDNFKSDHHDPNSNKAYNLGGDSTAWDYVYADDFINKSLGWYDNGVELQDGTFVSDMEAIRLIKPNKTYLNKNGSVGLDWTTLPLCVFREAHDRDTGIPYKKDKDGVAISPETGEKVGDGESITGMVSLLMGALKEVDQRLINIEKGIN